MLYEVITGLHLDNLTVNSRHSLLQHGTLTFKGQTCLPPVPIFGVQGRLAIGIELFFLLDQLFQEIFYPYFDISCGLKISLKGFNPSGSKVKVADGSVELSYNFV